MSACYRIPGKVRLALSVMLVMQHKIRLQNSLPWDVIEAKRHNCLLKGIRKIVPSTTVKCSYLDAASRKETPKTQVAGSYLAVAMQGSPSAWVRAVPV